MDTYVKHNAAIRAGILQAITDVKVFSGPSYMLLTLNDARGLATLMRGDVFGEWQDNTTDPGAAKTIVDITAFAASGFFLQVEKTYDRSVDQVRELKASGLPVFQKDADSPILPFKDANEAFLFKAAMFHLRLLAPTPD